MTRRSKNQERVFTVFFMFAVTFVSISAVALIYLGTAEAVRRNEKLFLQRAVLAAADPERAETVEAKDAPAWYRDHVRAFPNETTPERFEVFDPESRDTMAHVLIRTGNGLWGRITAVVGLNRTLTAFTGVTFVQQNETPGLGARIEEPWFKAQFRGKTGPFTLVPEGSQSASPREMDAITGATVTSAAVRDMLNNALREAPGQIGGGVPPAKSE